MKTTTKSPDKISDSIAFSSWKENRPPVGYIQGALGSTEKQFFNDKGYLVLDRALSGDEVDEINAEAVLICRNEDGRVTGIPSAPSHLTDDEILQESHCIHFPHKLSPLMKNILGHPSVVQALTTLVGPQVKAMQSMLFIKASGKPGQAWHQDEDYIPTRDRSLIGVWIALDDATMENGCLWIIPGSHRPGILWKQEWHGNKDYDCSFESRGFPYTEADAVPVEVRKGSVVLFNGYTLHRSFPNRAQSGFRRALVNHYMSATSMLPWRHNPGASMAMQDYRDIVMVAGDDPYAWKGIEDIAKPHVRTAGQGGCYNWVTKEPLAFNS